MKKILKRILPIVIAAVLIMSVMPINAFADVYSSGNYTYSIKSDNTVAITQYYGYGEGYIEDLYIPETIEGLTVSEIKSIAFFSDGCGTLYIPETITKIQVSAFSNINIKRFALLGENPSFEVVDGVIFSKDKKTLLFFPTNYQESIYTVPDGVEKIASWAFDGTNMVSTVILSDSVETIGSYAFNCCISLNSIVFGNGIKTIGEGAFLGCNELEPLYIPESIESLGDFAFDGCDDVKIFAPEGSAAAEFAADSGIDFEESAKPVSVTLQEAPNELQAEVSGWYNSYYDEATQQEYQWFQYSLSYTNIIITFDDETQETYTSEEYYEKFGTYLTVASDQSYYNQWQVGETHTFKIIALGILGEHSVTINALPQVSNFSVTVKDHKASIYENTNGEWCYYEDEEGNEQRYWYYSFANDDFLYSFSYNGSRYENIEYDTVSGILGYYPEAFSNQNETNQWAVGTNYIDIKLGNSSVRLSVEILTTPEIENFTIRPFSDIASLYENTNGHYENIYDNDNNVVGQWYCYHCSTEYFYYSFTIDGKEYTDLDHYEVGNLLGVNPEFVYETYQSPENPWEAGQNEVSIKLFDIVATTTIEIKEAPKIENLTVRPYESYASYFENTNGYYMPCYDEDGNEFDRYYYYNCYLDSFYYSFTFEGEEYTDISAYQIFELFGAGPQFVQGTEQSYHNQWSVGENEVSIILFNAVATTTVEIKEKPEIKNFTMKPYEEYASVYEKSNGWYIYPSVEFPELTEPWFVYDCYADWFSFSFTWEGKEYTNLSSTDIYDMFGVSLSEVPEAAQSPTNQWTIGMNEISYELFGVVATSYIEIKETPVDSIEFLTDLKLNYYTTDELFDLDGHKLKITFKDGTVIQHTVECEPNHYSSIYSSSINYQINGYSLTTQSYYDENDGYGYIISYMGKELRVVVTIEQPEFKNAELIKAPQNEHFINAVIRLTEQDDTTKDFTIKKAYYSGGYGVEDGGIFFEQCDLYLITDKGVFISHSEYERQNGEIISAKLYFLGNEISLSQEEISAITLEKKISSYIKFAGYDSVNNPKFNLEFNGEVTSENIDFLIYNYVDVEEYTAENIIIELRKALDIKGDIDLALSEGYDQENNLYSHIYNFSYMGTEIEYLSVTALENGNYKYVYDYWIEDFGYYTIVAEITSDGKIVSFSKLTEKYDINTDGEVDILDLVRLKKAALATEEVDTDFADLERDGSINGLDLAMLKKELFARF